MQTFKKGDSVAIINQTLGGKFFVEGRATIIGPVKGVAGQYRVRFSGSDTGIYDRFVDPAAQKDAYAYAASLTPLGRPSAA